MRSVHASACLLEADSHGRLLLAGYRQPGR